MPVRFRLLESQSQTRGVDYPAQTHIRAIAFGSATRPGSRSVWARIDTARGWVYLNPVVVRGCPLGSIAERPGDVSDTTNAEPGVPSRPAAHASVPACVPGATQACLCVGGASGVQSCALSGLGYEACVCAPAPRATRGNAPGPVVASTPPSSADMNRARPTTVDFPPLVGEQPDSDSSRAVALPLPTTLRCTAPEHESAGHCCGEGEVWSPSAATCVCVNPYVCESLPALAQVAQEPRAPSPAPTLTPAPVAGWVNTPHRTSVAVPVAQSDMHSPLDPTSDQDGPGAGPWVIAGIGALSFGAAGVFGGVLRANALNDRAASCHAATMSCDPSAADAQSRVESATLMTNVALVVGGVAVAGGALWWLLGQPLPRSSRRMTWTWGIEPTVGGSFLRVGGNL
jgi:hypothetical protein